MKVFYLFLGALFCGLLFLSENAFSQVTIGSNLTPHKDALLDLKQDGITKAGLLLPRVALVQSTSAQPLSSHTEGMTVYNTAKTGDVTPGFYYNNGSKWLKLYSAEDSFFLCLRSFYLLMKMTQPLVVVCLQLIYMPHIVSNLAFR